MSASRMRLATRLGLAFAAVVGLMLVGVVWAIVSLNQVNDQITLVIKDRFPKTRQAHDIIDALNLVARSTRNIALVSDQAAVKKEMERITDARRIIQENLDKLDASITSEEGRRLLGVMTTKRAAYVQVLDELMKMTQTAKRDDLGRFLLETMRGPQNDYMDSLMKLIEFQEGLVERDGNAAAHAVRADTIVLVSLSIASVILAAVLAWLIIRRISAQLGGEPDLAREVLANIGRGRLDNAIVLRSGDSASMMATMKAMQDSLNAFVAAQENMARRHAEGWIKEHIDASAFPGTFGKMATDINELVASHIAVKMRVVEVISMYARGDFSIDMDRLPGDKAKITAAMDEVKKSLLGVSSEIKNVVAAGVAGDFSRRIDTSRFEFMFRDMVQDLNTLAETCDVGFNDVLRVANALAAGDLSQTITKDYPGLFGQTKTGVNGTAQALAKIVGEIKNTVEAAAVRGDFSVKIDLSDKRGYTRELSELLNRLSDVTDTGLKDIARVLEAVAKGDLTEKITADYPGTFGNLKNYTNGTVRSLEQMLRQIREASETIHTAASEIASGNTDLSSRTEEQAASLEETASSMEELTSTVKQNAQNARQANQLAEGASEVAGKGGDVVGQVVTTMGAINESSRKIVDIIGVIDGIAFQTNILALNAAVEAARAGEQGRGFAVVAGEVRNLAQRSAAAAKEIKGLIGNSVEKVEDGNRLVEQAGRTMEEVVVAIKRVTDIMNEISAASLEQSNGIEQVSVAVTQMDETTQQNAALVEQAAASAEALSGQAGTLLEIVRRFKLNDEALQAARTPTLEAPAKPAAPRPALHHAPSRPVPVPARSVSRPAVRHAVPAHAAGGAEEDESWSEF